jgi:hypothetical protein
MAAVHLPVMPNCFIAHDRHRIPLFTAAWRWNVAVGQFLGDLAI